VTVVFLVFHLSAGNNEVVSVYNNNVVATIDVSGVRWLVFTNKVLSNSGRNAAEGCLGSVNEHPFASNFGWFLGVSLHGYFSAFSVALAATFLGFSSDRKSV